ncbi:unnamed protein product [Leptidea sinapis]|uniref:Uncharacterized protein n=1 Tax=Leptidea sinapis TaxID=189913 RepID=A0A5E4QKL4_9NEOP|nr:unnamed protein product [Leptidea sinapis]
MQGEAQAECVKTKAMLLVRACRGMGRSVAIGVSRCGRGSSCRLAVSERCVAEDSGRCSSSSEEARSGEPAAAPGVDSNTVESGHPTYRKNTYSRLTNIEIEELLGHDDLEFTPENR